MEKIASFTVNHLLLLPGVYVSRQDKVGSEMITTFDIRMKAPNREPALSAETQHTIEHLAATFLRNDGEWGQRVIYWGPMGCLTGSYLLLRGALTPTEILPLLRRMFSFIATYEGDIPGATAHDCGNYRLNDLPTARHEAQKYLEVLENISPAQMTYPED